MKIGSEKLEKRKPEEEIHWNKNWDKKGRSKNKFEIKATKDLNEK